MKNVELYVPKQEDLWFRELCMSDEKTMEYNAGYDVSYEGYHYETGCIDFPKQNWENWFNQKMTNPNFFYAYIKDSDTNEFVGYVNFNQNQQTKKATMGIVVYSKYHSCGYMRPAMKKLIEKAKQSGVKILTDTIPETRKNALRVFYDFGFVKMNEITSKKFNKNEIVAEVELII